MNFKNKFLLIIIIYFTAACSSIPKGTLLGATIGLGVGGIISSNQEDSTQKNTTLAVGAVLGSALGYLISNAKLNKQREIKSSPSVKDFAPRLNRPEVRRVWVPDQISGDEYISGHWKYSISQPAVWSKSEE
tara:strand:+ start:2424 stop:2819 length:396 start_codon:yes stop_codon:yes gene_type:complete